MTTQDAIQKAVGYNQLDLTELEYLYANHGIQEPEYKATKEILMTIDDALRQKCDSGKETIKIKNFDDDCCSEADKIAYALAFIKNAPIQNDDDVFGYEIAEFVLKQWLTRIKPPNEAASPLP